MTSLKNLIPIHEKAMLLTQDAMVAQIMGNQDDALYLFQEALELERKVTDAYLPLFEKEPTRSIVFKSAAYLAIQCKQFREAEKFITQGLSGNTPDDIAEELRNLYEEVNFKRHLELHSITLGHNELQLSINGDGVSYGIAPKDEIFDRCNTFISLATRSMERRLKVNYRSKGSTHKNIRTSLNSFISVPRAASFALTLRIGTNQINIFGVNETQLIIDEILTGIQLINDGKEEDLREQIQDESYYENFVTLVKDMAPDGDKIRQVGFTTVRNGEEKIVRYVRKRSDIIRSVINKSLSEFEQSEAKWVSGILLVANGRQNKNYIGLSVKTRESEHATDYPKIFVPNDALNELVTRYWNDVVKVLIKPKGKYYELIEIERDSSF